MRLRIFILFLVIFFSFNFVSSKAVCGEVFSEEGISPSWFEVKVFSVKNETFEKNCLVSPDQFRYCCSIEDSGWEVGDYFEAKIIDNVSGYVAKSVLIELTNSPYDVFPVLNLEKVIKFNSPQFNFNISSSNLTFVEINYLEDSENFYFQGNFLMLENNSFSDFFEIEFGENNFEARAFYENHIFVELFDYFLLEDLNFSREIVCDGCKNNKIRKGEKVDVFLNYNLSSNVSGLKIYEFIPFGWEILDSEKEPFYQGGDFQIISWTVEGNSFSSNYSFLSPEDSEKEVLFRNYVDELLIDEQNYNLYGVVPPVFSAPNKKSSSRRISPTYFSKVSNTYPMISENDSLLLAVYSDESTDEGSLDIFRINFTNKIYNRSLEFIEAYELYTNLGQNFDRLYFELNLNDSLLEKNDYRDFFVYGIDSKGNFVRLTGNFLEEDNLKLMVDSDKFFKEIVVFGVKNNLTIWDKIVEWYWTVLGFKTGVI